MSLGAGSTLASTTLRQVFLAPNNRFDWRFKRERQESSVIPGHQQALHLMTAIWTALQSARARERWGWWTWCALLAVVRLNGVCCRQRLEKAWQACYTGAASVAVNSDDCYGCLHYWCRGEAGGAEGVMPVSLWLKDSVRIYLSEGEADDVKFYCSISIRVT